MTVSHTLSSILSLFFQKGTINDRSASEGRCYDLLSLALRAAGPVTRTVRRSAALRRSVADFAGQSAVGRAISLKLREQLGEDLALEAIDELLRFFTQHVMAVVKAVVV